MKKHIHFLSVFVLLSSVVFWGCNKKDELAPFIDGFEIENFDLFQVTNDNPNITVNIQANDNEGINNVRVNIYPKDSKTVIATNALSNITTNNIGRITIRVPFPSPKQAPSGVYTIEQVVQDNKGNTNSKSYNVSILNNQQIKLCNFPNQTLPPGKNVWLQVSVAEESSNNLGDLFVSGNFEGWSGGGKTEYKLTKLSNTCYYIALNLDGNSEFKVTRGTWGQVMKGPAGEELNNIKWNNKETLEYTIYNWDDRQPFKIFQLPFVLPNSVISTGKTTVIADVKSDDAKFKYYLVKKGATSLGGAIPMERVTGTTKVAGAVPKESNAEYVVVKDVITKTSVNGFGFEVSAKIDGMVNPVEINVGGFKTEVTSIDNLFLVGGATPGGWNNPVPVPSQQLTKTATGFEITINLKANEGYLLLPVNGSWDTKVGTGTPPNTPLAGNIALGGGDFKSPADAGNYKIEVNLVNGMYKLTKL